MKNKVCLCALAAVAMGLSAISAKVNFSGVSAESLSNTATSWTSIAGGQQVSSTDNGVKFTGMGGFGAASYYSTKVKIDGLSFRISSEGGANEAGSCFGFYFDGAVETGASSLSHGPVFSLWDNLYGQLRWHLSSSHDYNQGCTCYNNVGDSSYGGLTSQPLGISNLHSAAGTYNGYTVSFAQLDATWVEVTFHDDFDQFWYNESGVTANNADATNKTIKTYLRLDQFENLDEDGYTYLYAFGFQSTTFSIENLTSNPTYVPSTGVEAEKEQLTSQINDYVGSLDQDDYKAADFATFKASIDSLLASVQAAETSSDITQAKADFEDLKATLVKMEETKLDTWTVTRGDSSQLGVYETEENLRIRNLHTYSAEVTRNDKVTLDGLSMTFGFSGNYTNSSIGFYFSESASYNGWVNAVFSMWHNLYSGQTRLHVGESHDYNQGSLIHSEPKDDSATGFGVASSMVINSQPHDLINIKFEHVTTRWWKVIFTGVGASTLWGNNINYDADSGSCFGYLQASQLPVDEEGKIYLHVVGIGEGGCAIIKDFHDGEFKEIAEDPATPAQITEMQQKILAINDGSWLIDISAILERGITACTEEGITPSRLEEIYSIILNGCIATQNEALGLDYEITEADDTANFVECYGGNFGKRLFDDGSFIMAAKMGYGSRGRIGRQYDSLNYNLQIDLSKLPLNTATPITFTTGATNYVSEENNYHFEFYKVQANKYLVVLGNTTSHNVSLDEWKTDTDGSYTGRYFYSNSGFFNIAVSTDFASGTTYVGINAFSESDFVPIPTSLLVGGATEVTGPVKTYVTIGVMNGEGYANLLVAMMDQEAYTYYSGLENYLNSSMSELVTVVSQLVGSVPEEGLDDDTVEQYAAMYDLIEAEIAKKVAALDPWDYNKYVRDPIAEIMAVMDAPLVAYTAKVTAAKEEAIQTINTLVNLDDYREEEQLIITDLLTTAGQSVAEATTLGGVKSIVEALICEISEIPTNADYELAERKVAAKDEITNYLDLSYYTETLDTVTELINNYKDLIDACESIEEVNAKVAEFKGLADLLPNDDEYELMLAQAAALERLETFAETLNQDDYDLEGQNAIAAIYMKACEDIAAATDVDALDAIVDKAIADMQAVPTKPSESSIVDESSEPVEESSETPVVSSEEPVVSSTEETSSTSQDEPAKGGCGGSIIAASGLIAMVSLLGLGLVSLKKKHE